MPYYAGDYYRGDYYRGDFLGIGKAIKKIGGGLLNVATNFIPGGGLVKTVAQAAASALRGKPARVESVGLTPTGPGLQALAPGFNPVSLNMAGGSVPAYRPTGLGPDDLMFPRRRRRMNVTNVRALRRAGRRVRGFLKLAGKLGALPVSRSGKKLFKRRGRR